MKRWFVFVCSTVIALSSVAGASASRESVASAEIGCKSFDGKIPTYQEWRDRPLTGVSAKEIRTNSKEFNAKLAAGTVQAFVDTHLCQDSLDLITKRLAELGYTSKDIADMVPPQMELIAVKGITKQEVEAQVEGKVGISAVTTTELYHGVVLSPYYDYCPNEAACRRIESSWWWKDGHFPFPYLTDRLGISWSQSWTMYQPSAWSSHVEYACEENAPSQCRSFYFMDSSLWDTIIDNGFSYRYDVHIFVWHNSTKYVVQHWQGSSEMDIYKDLNCGNNCNTRKTLTVLQRYLHQTLAAPGFGLSFSKSPSITVSPTWVLEQSYDKTYTWRYYE